MTNRDAEIVHQRPPFRRRDSFRDVNSDRLCHLSLDGHQKAHQDSVQRIAGKTPEDHKLGEAFARQGLLTANKQSCISLIAMQAVPRQGKAGMVQLQINKSSNDKHQRIR